MFGCQGNYWIWILIAFFLLYGSGGCGCDIKGSSIFGCGNNSWWIIILVAFFLLGNKGFAC